MLTPPRARTKRIFERLDELYEIGGGEGANRPGFSGAEDEAHELVAGWMRDGGLETEVDAAGNLVGRSPGRRPDLAEVWTGSHVDSVPRGGRFDGALGSVAGLEAVELAAAERCERTLAVAVFRAEETGCHGSRARAAERSLPGAFLELHVEQGPVLANAGAPLGVVTAIAGIARGGRTFVGSAAHAGTTPMDARRDALVEAAGYVLSVRDAAAAIEGTVATVGHLELEPGAENVVPALVRLRVDARAPDAARLERLVAELGLEPDYRVEPVPMAERVRAVLREEIERLALPAVELPSGAGHDAGILAAAGVDAGMLFVRSLAGGASHCPEEESSEEDVALSVEALAGALRRLAA
ncbi:MAG: M20/M25/M40 family metallo-hydrolase [Thermoleophilia bacterium]|nr:M20/M25/M40 family metallo-hydrolase [Thermoleophilia bacterium]